MFIHNFLVYSSTLLALSAAAPAQSTQDKIPFEFFEESASSSSSSSCGYWPGFNKLANVFAFGDSYTSPGFRVTGVKPTKDHPLGEPVVQDNGAGLGPNWLAYLTARDNASAIATYNMAAPGATLDSRLVGSLLPLNAKSLRTQIEETWMPVYGARGEVQGRFRNSWAAQDSLFAVWIGINDVLRTHASKDEKLVPAIFDEYDRLLEELYNSGARNFLLLDVPPLQDAPVAQEWVGSGPKLTKAVDDWNSRLNQLSTKFRESHQGATMIMFSANKVFTAIRKDPAKFKQTAGMSVVGPEFCSLPNDNRNNSTSSSCKETSGQFFWLDLVHSSTKVHSAIAFEVSKQLNNVNASLPCTA